MNGIFISTTGSILGRLLSGQYFSSFHTYTFIDALRQNLFSASIRMKEVHENAKETITGAISHNADTV